MSTVAQTTCRNGCGQLKRATGVSCLLCVFVVARVFMLEPRGLKLLGKRVLRQRGSELLCERPRHNGAAYPTTAACFALDGELKDALVMACQEIRRERLRLYWCDSNKKMTANQNSRRSWRKEHAQKGRGESPKIPACPRALVVLHCQRISVPAATTQTRAWQKESADLRAG